MKIKNLKVKTKAIMLAGAIVVSSVGVSDYAYYKIMKRKSYIQKCIVEKDFYSLAVDPNIVLIKLDNNKYHISRKVDYSLITDASDLKKYKKYKTNNVTTYLYFDIFTGELLSVNQINEDKITSDFIISDILEEEIAYLSAANLIGVKEEYNKDELEYMVDQINKATKNKKYVK